MKRVAFISRIPLGEGQRDFFKSRKEGEYPDLQAIDASTFHFEGWQGRPQLFFDSDVGHVTDWVGLGRALKRAGYTVFYVTSTKVPFGSNAERKFLASEAVPEEPNRESPLVKLKCGCIALSGMGSHEYFVIKPCDDDEGDISIGWRTRGDTQQEEEGVFLNVGDAVTLLFEIRDLVADGYRFRDLKRLLR